MLALLALLAMLRYAGDDTPTPDARARVLELVQRCGRGSPSFTAARGIASVATAQARVARRLAGRGLRP